MTDLEYLKNVKEHYKMYMQAEEEALKYDVDMPNHKVMRMILFGVIAILNIYVYINFQTIVFIVVLVVSGYLAYISYKKTNELESVFNNEKKAATDKLNKIKNSEEYGVYIVTFPKAFLSFESIDSLIKSLESGNTTSIEDAYEILLGESYDAKEKLFESYECTINISNIFKFNEASGEIMLKTFDVNYFEFFNISEILDIDYIFEDSYKVKLSASKTVGMLMGAQKYQQTDISKKVNYVDRLGIKITTNRGNNDYIYSMPVTEQTKVSDLMLSYSDSYVEIINYIRDYYKFIELQNQQNQKTHQQVQEVIQQSNLNAFQQSKNETSVNDLYRIKELYDSGAINLEEYNKLKDNLINNN